MLRLVAEGHLHSCVVQKAGSRLTRESGLQYTRNTLDCTANTVYLCWLMNETGLDVIGHDSLAVWICLYFALLPACSQDAEGAPKAVANIQSSVSVQLLYSITAAQVD